MLKMALRGNQNGGEWDILHAEWRQKIWNAAVDRRRWIAGSHHHVGGSASRWRPCPSGCTTVLLVHLGVQLSSLSNWVYNCPPCPSGCTTVLLVHLGVQLSSLSTWMYNCPPCPPRCTTFLLVHQGLQRSFLPAWVHIGLLVRQHLSSLLARVYNCPPFQLGCKLSALFSWVNNCPPCLPQTAYVYNCPPRLSGCTTVLLAHQGVQLFFLSDWVNIVHGTAILFVRHNVHSAHHLFQEPCSPGKTALLHPGQGCASLVRAICFRNPAVQER